MSNYPKKCGTCRNYMSKILCPIESKGYNPTYNSKVCNKYYLDDLFANAYRWKNWKQLNLLENIND